MPDCVAHVACGVSAPRNVVTRRVRFEDAHEAIGDPPSGSRTFAMALNRRER
jgi:hypothetical protein